MGRLLRVASVLLVLSLSLVCGFLGALTAADGFRSTLRDYVSSGNVIYLHDVPEEAGPRLLTVLETAAGQSQGLVVRADALLDPVTGDDTGLRIGFAGSADAPGASLSYLGTPVFTSENLESLLTARSGLTLGLDEVSADELSPLPAVRGQVRVVGLKLADLIERSGTVNGTYRLIGFDDAATAALRQELTAVLGADKDLATPMSGSYVYDALLEDIGLVVLAVAWLVLVFVLVMVAYQGSDLLGVHVLLGWGRMEYAWSLFRVLLVAVVLGAGLTVGLHLWLLEGFRPSVALLARGLLADAPAALLTLAAVGLASWVLCRIKPVDAIRGRVSTRVVAALLAVFYLASSLAVVGAMHWLDGPLRGIAEIQEVRDRWRPYESTQILYHEQVGQDQASLTGQSGTHDEDWYEWYRSIEHEDGVELVNTSYLDRQTAQEWAAGGTYQSVPDRSLWELRASPSYLEREGWQLDPQWVAQAEAGTRVFLLPDTLSQGEAQAERAWLEEDSLRERDSEIRTAFDATREVAFYTYHPDRAHFMWSTNLREPATATDPVVLVTTSANMTPFESESLSAVGLANSYVKLSAEAAERFGAPTYLATYHLADNSPDFRSVADFIAGITKSLQETVALFGGVVAVIIGLDLVVVVCLVRLYATSRRQEVAVRRLLGHSLVRVFAPPLVLVLASGVLCLALSMLLRSTSGTVVVAASTAIQALLLLYQARRAAATNLSTLIHA